MTKSGKTVLLIDANATVGSVASPSLGGKGCDNEKDNGRRFTLFLGNSGMAAINTWHDSGWTWKSAQGPSYASARVDYVALELAESAAVRGCLVLDDLDLSMLNYDDHRAVKVGFEWRGELRPDTENKPFRINKFNVKEQWRRDLFEQSMWAFKSPQHVGVNEHADAFNRYLKKCATKAFGKHVDQPRKPWIANGTWTFVRWLALVRRASTVMSAAAHKLRLKCAWYAWKSLLHLDFIPSVGQMTRRRRLIGKVPASDTVYN